jgi:hypothetical protein
LIIANGIQYICRFFPIDEEKSKRLPGIILEKYEVFSKSSRLVPPGWFRGMILARFWESAQRPQEALALEWPTAKRGVLLA